MTIFNCWNTSLPNGEKSLNRNELNAPATFNSFSSFGHHVRKLFQRNTIHGQDDLNEQRLHWFRGLKSKQCPPLDLEYLVARFWKRTRSLSYYDLGWVLFQQRLVRWY